MNQPSINLYLSICRIYTILTMDFTEAAVEPYSFSQTIHEGYI